MDPNMFPFQFDDFLHPDVIQGYTERDARGVITQML